MENNNIGIEKRASHFVKEWNDDLGGTWNEDIEAVKLALIQFASREKSLSSPIVPEVVEWHYKRMVGPHSVYELDDLGKRGWELCSSYSENNFLYQIFKRKKQNK